MTYFPLYNDTKVYGFPQLTNINIPSTFEGFLFIIFYNILEIIDLIKIKTKWTA
jgi:hypothetical protein